ncbi:MAG: tagaturonate reductase [Flavihumibacter sp.]|nr:tagaturonate reductase [Flavihumibacter sp.]
MQLSKKTVPQLNATEALFQLPEKVLQFGTGVLLRALPDYFIDKANKQGIFNGRVVVVKSTDSGGADAFAAQDNLYTVCVRGIENGKNVSEDIVNAAISRVLSAKTNWNEILDCAHSKEMQLIISNTTEVGIQLVQDDIGDEPPVSFPGKLLAFLYERFKVFEGAPESGMVIVPTELITDNGTKLESIVLELAHRNGLDFKFIEWLENHNTFCNSLVDRIVPGKPGKEELAALENTLGYNDELLTMSEVFRLWAIEGDEKVKKILSFAAADAGVVIADDITQFKELKLRLLNGTHTFNCGLAFLAGFDITRESVTDDVYAVFAKQLMQQEIAPAIPFAIDAAVKKDFADKVFDRFCNPAINHQWISITMQYTSKMKMRNVPLLQQYYSVTGKTPLLMATGFAAYLLFMKAVKEENGKYFGLLNDKYYEIKDDAAALYYNAWQQNNPEQLVQVILSNETLWETNLAQLPGFAVTVTEQLHQLIENGAMAVVEALVNKNELV